MNFDEYDLLEYELNTAIKTKITNAKQLIELNLKDKQNISLSFSGGKDSLASLLLLLEFDIRPILIWFNSTYEYPETREYIYNIASKYNLKLREIKPDCDPLQEKINAGFFNLNNINKINAKILSPWWSTNKEYDCVVTGLRCSESKTRKKMIGKHGQYFYNKSFGTYSLYPVAYFQNKDIFSFIASKNEKPHPIYYKAKTLKEREYIRVNWYIFSIGNNGYYVFLKREYPNIYNQLCIRVPEIRQYV